MKKKMYVMMLIALLAGNSAMSDEIKLEDKARQGGYVNSWIYCFSRPGNVDYKLDWQSFYERMKKVADSEVYKYMYVIMEDNVNIPGDMLVHRLTTYDYKLYDEIFLGETSQFSYVYQKGKCVVRMLFSNEYFSDAFYDYESAVKKWNYYLDLM